MSAHPTAADPHLMRTDGTLAERQDRRPWHLAKIRTAERRRALLVAEGKATVEEAHALTRSEIEHHQRCLDALAYHSPSVRTVGGSR